MLFLLCAFLFNVGAGALNLWIGIEQDALFNTFIAGGNVGVAMALLVYIVVMYDD